MIYRAGLTKAQCQNIAVNMISAHILQSVTEAGHASLLLSGGSTPGPIYEKLSTENLPWNNVDIGLVDERWVEESDDGSNAALIRRTILQNHAKDAKFTPMKTAHKTASAGQSTVETNYKPLVSKNSFAVLGMGTDGHVCSWFPKSKGLAKAVNPKNHNMVQAISANKSNVTGDYLERMTLTLSALALFQSVLLLITGDAKRKVFESGDPSLPVSHLLNPDNDINLTTLHAA